MKMRTILAATAVLTSLVTMAGVKVGEVGTDFVDSLAYAKEHNVPIAVTYGNTSCSYCNSLAKTIEGSDELKAWIADKKILFVEKHEAFGSKDADYVAAEKWITSINRKLPSYPFMALYWVKKDGTVAVSTAFVAHKGTLPCKTPKGDFAGQIIGTLEMYFGDYEPGEEPEPTPTEPGDASFVTTDTAEDRLEATDETETVYVPLTRETTDKAAGNTIAVKYPDGSTKTVPVAWQVGEDEKYVAVDMPAKFTKGGKIGLTLKDTSGAAIDTSSIALVEEPANHPTNPHWVGEFTSKELPYGEWTMDYATAVNKLTSQGGYIVACFSGVKWCPHCIGIDDSLFADKKFYSWAKKNKVILVLFDQPRLNSTDKKQYEGPRLLSYNNEFGKSGASYLSRKGLKGNDKDVLAAMDLQWKLTQKWLAPESTALRLSNPTVLLLNRTGTDVAARFSSYELDDRTFPTAENLNRLSDLLLLVDGNEDEGYRTVSPLAIAAGDGEATTLQINDKKKFFALDGVKAGQYVKVTALTDDKDAPAIALALYAGTNLVSSGTGRVITDRVLTAKEVEDLSVKVSSFAESAPYGKNTSFDVTVSAEAGDEEMMRTVKLSELSKAEQKLLNPSLYTKKSATVPIYKTLVGTKVLVGTLAVSVTSANKISAKYDGIEKVSFSGTWDEINLMSGVVTTDLAKSGVALALTMDAAGGFTAKLNSTGAIFGEGLSAAGDLSVYQGDYTVTLVDADGEEGTGYLTVKVAKAGKATVSGMMPDGTTISASATIAPDKDGAGVVALYKTSNKGTLSLPVAIEPDAASTWGIEGKMDTVRLATDATGWWKGASASAETIFDVYGGFWKTTTPADICEQFDLSPELDVVIGGETNDVVLATSRGFTVTKDVLTSLTFTKAKGTFSGKAKLPVDGGKTVNATVKGVLLPGWIDCGCTEEPVVERPYGSGTVYYKSGKNTVSMPIDLVAEKLPE